jgi:hypothetical protein
MSGAMPLFFLYAFVAWTAKILFLFFVMKDWPVSDVLFGGKMMFIVRTIT